MKGIEMDHDEAVRLKATERYLLDELDPDLRDEFEEHMFDCQECAVDVRAGAMFVEQSKVALAETPTAAPVYVPASHPTPGWLAWLRPAFTAPVLALLLAVIGYQNFIRISARGVAGKQPPASLNVSGGSAPAANPELASNQPQDLPYASINVDTRGTAETKSVTMAPNQGFVLMVTIPPNAPYSSYTLELHNPAGGLQWSLNIPASASDDLHPVTVSGAGLEQGTYNLIVIGVTPAGQSKDLGTHPVSLQIQK